VIVFLPIISFILTILFTLLSFLKYYLNIYLKKQFNFIVAGRISCNRNDID